MTAGFTPEPGQTPVGGGFTDMIASSVTQATVGTSQFLAAAKAGSFRVAPEVVAEFRKSIQEMLVELNSQRKVEFDLTQPTKLGSHPYGSQVADHNMRGAESAVETIKALRQVLADLDEAFGLATKSYTEHEANTADALKKFDGETQ